MNSDGIHFLRQGFREAFNCKFRSTVEAQPSRRVEAAHGRQIDYVSGTLAPHHWQDGSRHLRQAKKIYIEERAILGGKRLFNQTE